MCAGVNVNVGMCVDLCGALDVCVDVRVADMGLMMEAGMGLGVAVVVDVGVDVWTHVDIDEGVAVGTDVELDVAVDMTPRPACVAAALSMGLWIRRIGCVFVCLEVGVDVEVDVGLGADVDMAVCVPVAVRIRVGIDEDVGVVAREPLLKNPSLEPV